MIWNNDLMLTIAAFIWSRIQ